VEFTTIIILRQSVRRFRSHVDMPRVRNRSYNKMHSSLQQEHNPDLYRRALENYATFYELSTEDVPPDDVTKSFGRISGWAFLTRTPSDEAIDVSTEKESNVSAPPCIRKLARILQETNFSDSCLKAIALKNFLKFNPNLSNESRLTDVIASPPGVLGWAMPTFSLAQENYEYFKEIESGNANLKDVISSSAGLLGWAAYKRNRVCVNPYGNHSNLRFKRRDLATSHYSDDDSTESLGTEPERFARNCSGSFGEI